MILVKCRTGLTKAEKTMDDKLTAISLFSGAGGMDIGVQQAGFNILSGLELA